MHSLTVLPTKGLPTLFLLPSSQAWAEQVEIKRSNKNSVQNGLIRNENTSELRATRVHGQILIDKSITAPGIRNNIAFRTGADLQVKSEPRITPSMNESQLRALFTKPYGEPGPTQDQWRSMYADDVLFIDPTQERHGVDAYIAAQNGLMQRCDDIFLETEAVAVNESVAFIEWRMGLKIKGIEFIYPGATSLSFNSEGKIFKHRDYFDFVGPTFGPVPLIGGFVRWLYKRFVD